MLASRVDIGRKLGVLTLAAVRLQTGPAALESRATFGCWLHLVFFVRLVSPVNWISSFRRGTEGTEVHGESRSERLLRRILFYGLGT